MGSLSPVRSKTLVGRIPESVSAAAVAAGSYLDSQVYRRLVVF